MFGTDWLSLTRACRKCKNMVDQKVGKVMRGNAARVFRLRATSDPSRRTAITHYQRAQASLAARRRNPPCYLGAVSSLTLAEKIDRISAAAHAVWSGAWCDCRHFAANSIEYVDVSARCRRWALALRRSITAFPPLR